MVFSRCNVLTPELKFMLLDRHINLREKLTGDDFIREPSLIVNFLCCLFRGDLMRNLPDILYKHRFSEIPLAFYLEQKGSIGYISTPLSVYRQHNNGYWSGATRDNQLTEALLCRQTALIIADIRFKEKLAYMIEHNYALPLKQNFNIDAELIIINHSPLFNGEWYLKKYKIEEEYQSSPAKHYLYVGWKVGYNPSSSFNGNKYLSFYNIKDMNPLLHYE